MEEQLDEDELLTFQRYAKWKVNPVVHSTRGVLGYARVPRAAEHLADGSLPVLRSMAPQSQAARSKSLRRGSFSMSRMPPTMLSTVAP